MSIWEYKSQSQEKKLVKAAVYKIRCIFCDTPLITIKSGYRDYLKTFVRSNIYDSPPPSRDLDIKSCRTCGWWNLISNGYNKIGYGYHKESKGTIGSLKNFNLNDISTPIEEVRAFLTAKYTSRFIIHPKVFEETVASVFRDLGYYARVTAFAKDGGIDIILDGPNKETIGVQVKRYRNTIGVEHIRALAGALLIKGYTKGAFITTSRFSSVAVQGAKDASSKGYPIELFDAGKFFDALKVTQRKHYKSEEEFCSSIVNFSTLIPVESGGGYWRPD